MNNYPFTTSFSFREVNYMNSLKNNFKQGVKHNYIIYLKKGKAKIVTENEPLHIKSGDIVHIPRGLKYNSYWYGNPEITFNAYAYLNYPGNINHSFKLQKIIPNAQIMGLINEIPTDNIINCYSVGKFYLLLNELFKQMEAENAEKKQTILKEAMDYIIMHPNSLIPDVAMHCNMSETSLYNLFKSYAYTTPAKFKLSVKLEKALHYIISTDMPIEEISNLCGFSSSSYFRKNFYSMYKKTPSEMRRGNII